MPVQNHSGRISATNRYPNRKATVATVSEISIVRLQRQIFSQASMNRKQSPIAPIPSRNIIDIQIAGCMGVTSFV
jgi:hypothetical protein